MSGHRDSSGQNLCSHNPMLWQLLTKKIEPKISIPDWPNFLKDCAEYRKSFYLEFAK